MKVVVWLHYFHFTTYVKLSFCLMNPVIVWRPHSAKVWCCNSFDVVTDVSVLVWLSSYFSFSLALEQPKPLIYNFLISLKRFKLIHQIKKTWGTILPNDLWKTHAPTKELLLSRSRSRSRFQRSRSPPKQDLSREINKQHRLLDGLYNLDT
jgi:hypothetical protein